MLFGYFTLFVALIISAVAAYYSIVGLTAIFAAAVIPIIVMGLALELGKLTAAVWLKLNWHRATLTYKLYLVPAVAMLMVLTSMGIFGFLSKAHSDQSLVSGDALAKIQIYDEKIKTAKENIETDRKQLKQMDEAVDQVMARSTTEDGAAKSNAIRKTQARDRSALAKNIEANQKLIATLNEEAAPIRAEVRKVEAEVGPIKYIAALIYGDNPDANLLESAVRWVIILIVAVFDPLALVLILAAQQSLKWAKREDSIPEKDTVPQDEINTVSTKDNNIKWPEVPPVESPIPSEVVIASDEKKSLFEQYPYLARPFVHFQNLEPMVYKPEPSEQYVSDVKTNSETDLSDLPETQQSLNEQSNEQPLPEISDVQQLSVRKKAPTPVVPETLSRQKPPMPSVPEAINVSKLQADNSINKIINSGFGVQFPTQANKGDTFLRVDNMPNKLFKFNGFKWIEIDKNLTDSYSYDERYINYLIEKLETGEYDIEQLSAIEQELVAQKLQRKNDTT